MIKQFINNIKTTEGRRNIKNYIIGTFKELILQKVLKEEDTILYLERKEALMTNCKINGFCEDCGCNVPDMFWVKECKGKCNHKQHERSNSRKTT